jgi:hypothetical protein
MYIYGQGQGRYRDMDTDRDRDRDGVMDPDRDRDWERDEDRDTDGDGDTERDRYISAGNQIPGNNFLIRISPRFEIEFKNNLGYESGVHMGLIDEKTEAENLMLMSH